MGARLAALPFFVILMGLGSLAMLVPAVHGLMIEDFNAMRVFFYGAILSGTFTLLIGIATAGYDPSSVARSQLVALLGAFTILPVMFAIPFYEAIANTTFLNAWFEMVSSFTTTGASVYDNAGRLTPSLHLWRATVGWLGGLLIWITAAAVFAPLNIGGFEVRATGGGLAQPSGGFSQIAQHADPSVRLMRYTAKLVPIYAGLTGALWLGLVMLGEVSYVALCHAMAILSTSGISPIGGLYFSVSGFWGELLMVGFLVFALSRLTFSRGTLGGEKPRLSRDPEFIVAMVLIAGTTLLLFLRHYGGSMDETRDILWQELFQALWGSIFTVTSFLTTTGFESRYWEGAAIWSGLGTPGLFLSLIHI